MEEESTTGSSWNPKVHPQADGLYDPQLEKEACGVGFVVSIDGVRSNKVSCGFWLLAFGFSFLFFSLHNIFHHYDSLVPVFF